MISSFSGIGRPLANARLPMDSRYHLCLKAEAGERARGGTPRVAGRSPLQYLNSL
jgi:hypothetical protein